jgi:nicotinate-nucleotide pyrophosphorylase (carboxylating)
MHHMIDNITLRKTVESALAEDIGSGDITSMLTVPADATSRAIITLKEDGVIAGIDVAEMVFNIVDPTVTFKRQACDGDKAAAGTVIATAEGSSRSLLAAERVALNFMQRLSGIATAASRYVSLVAGTKARIVDTRKTTPGLRALEKYAVRVGGASNHRFALYDGSLIKDNHIAAAGGVGKAVRSARSGAPHTLRVEVEVRNLEELEEAISAGAEIILLDNMDFDTMRRAVAITAGRVVLEASGGVSESTVASVAATGVDLISVGALTHSVRALDIGMDFEG